MILCVSCVVCLCVVYMHARGFARNVRVYSRARVRVCVCVRVCACVCACVTVKHP